MPYTQSIQDVVKRYLNGETTKEIARSLGVSGETVRRWLEENNIPRRSHAERVRIYSHRTDAFARRDPVTAYYAGFIMADGCVTGSNLSIMLNRRDEHVLIGLQEFLQYTGYVTHRTRTTAKGKTHEYSTLCLTAHDLFADLATWGVVPRKSKYGSLQNINLDGVEEFFFRGLFDGDGCAHRRPSDGSLYINLCGTPLVIDRFRDWCWRSVREVGNLNRRQKTHHVVQFSGKRAEIVGQLLYASPVAPRLARKENLIRGLTSNAVVI